MPRNTGWRSSRRTPDAPEVEQDEAAHELGGVELRAVQPDALEGGCQGVQVGGNVRQTTRVRTNLNMALGKNARATTAIGSVGVDY